jgi:hypothetical protein
MNERERGEIVVPGECVEGFLVLAFTLRATSGIFLVTTTLNFPPDMADRLHWCKPSGDEWERGQVERLVQVVVAAVAAAVRGGTGRITREAARVERAKEREIGQATLFMTAPLPVGLWLGNPCTAQPLSG